MDDASDVYRRFVALWANGAPVRAARELTAALRAAGVSGSEVSDAWLRSLSPEWVHGESEAPFADARVNKLYRRELGQ